MTANEKPIGVFDSGIGGLTVVRALMRQFPHENIVYFGDTARVPYGPKSPQVVREYALQDTEFILSNDVKMIVVACNTVSAVALEVVQKRAGSIPITGVIVPGAAAAVRATKNKRIGVIGTLGTIASNIYKSAISQIDPAIEVFSQACPLFVPLAEEGWTHHPATDLIAKEYLFPLTTQRIDTLVLGCTHYPILRDAIDSGEATAGTVEEILNTHNLRNPSTELSNIQFHVSDVPHKFLEVGERFLGQRLGRIHKVGGFDH